MKKVAMKGAVVFGGANGYVRTGLYNYAVRAHKYSDGGAVYRNKRTVCRLNHHNVPHRAVITNSV